MDSKEKIGFRNSPVKAVLLVVASVIFGLVLGTVLFVDESDAAVTQAARTAESQVATCHTYGGDAECRKVRKRHKAAAREINTREIPHTKRNFDMRRAFQRPAASRRIMVRRIMAAMAASQGQSSDAQMMCCSQAAARAIYVRITDQPSCGALVGPGADLSTRWRTEMMCRMNAWEGNGSKEEWISKREIRVYGTVIVCGAAWAGLIGRAASATLMAVGVAGSATGCSLSMWDALD